MKRTIRRDDITIECGKASDSFEKLEKLCDAEAGKIMLTLDVPNDAIIEIPCWTAGFGFAELIGVEKFSRDENGKIVHELDMSESTL